MIYLCDSCRQFHLKCLNVPFGKPPSEQRCEKEVLRGHTTPKYAQRSNDKIICSLLPFKEWRQNEFLDVEKDYRVHFAPRRGKIYWGHWNIHSGKRLEMELPEGLCDSFYFNANVSEYVFRDLQILVGWWNKCSDSLLFL